MSRQSLRRLLVVGAALAACVGGSAAGCGGQDQRDTVVSTTGAAASGTGGASSAATTIAASTSISTGTLGGASPGWEPPPPPPDPCLPAPNPDGIPDGWVEDLDWACKCRLYYPKTKDLLPPPIQWEACGGELPDGIECRQMVLDWSDSPDALGLSAQFDRNPDGTGVLLIRRGIPTAAFDVIADVDGPVRSAIGFPRMKDPYCEEWPGAFHEGNVVFTMLGDSYLPPSAADEGLIGGPLDEVKPGVLLHYKKQADFMSGWAVGAKWLGRMTPGYEVIAYPWSDLTQSALIGTHSVEPWDKAVDKLVISGDAFFWWAGDLYQFGIESWDPVHGMRHFQRWPGDYNRGAGDFGTDGVDVVWAYGEGKGPNDMSFATNSVMTAKFTTDPAALKPKRLGAYSLTYLGNDPIQVGCGRAAFLDVGNVGEPGVYTHVLRLSDGWSWAIPRTSGFKLYRVLGVTCDEVFILVNIDGRHQIARIKLDSLGPGTPPD